MKARKYKSRIDIYQDTEMSDEYAGVVDSTPNLVGSSWCNIKTLSPGRLTEIGYTGFDYGIVVNLRYRDDLSYYQENLYFKYKGVDYFFQSIVEKDLDSYEVEIIATARI